MAATSYYNHKTGNGWRRIQTGPNKGKYQAYKNHQPTNRIKSNLTLGSGVVKAISKSIQTSQKNRQAELIGKGSKDNPQFIVNARGRKIPNPNYKPQTTKPETKLKVNKGGETNNNNTGEVKTENKTDNNNEQSTSTKKLKLDKSAGPTIGKDGNITPEYEKRLQENKAKSDAEDRATYKKNWLENTANSPAAKAGFSPEQRWAQHVKHQNWKKEKGRNHEKLAIGSKKKEK